jgi:glycerophosphoryl diester phosphodiesterase
MPAPRAVEVIAHRGASAYAPENTLAAYDLAVSQGADAIELDVRVTADGELVLLHDPTLLRTAGEPTEVSALTARVMGRLDELLRPPSLDAVLSRYTGRTRFLIDVKDPTPHWEMRVVDAIARHGLGGRATVQSFDLEGLRRLHAHAPHVPLAALFGRRTRPRERLAEVAAFACAIGPWHGAVDAELVAEAHALGLKVRPWTVDDAGEVARLVALGVDGLITNAPDLVRGALA